MTVRIFLRNRLRDFMVLAGMVTLLSMLFCSCKTLSMSSDGLFGSSSTSETSKENTSLDARIDPDAGHWDIASLDTAKDADYLSAIEKDVVLEMNKVRNNPKQYAELYIQPELGYYNGNLYSRPGQISIQTQEGKKAVEACIAALSNMKSVPRLTPELGLSLGAKDHTADQGKTGKTGHDGSDRSTPFTRINRYGSGYTAAGENIAYGPTTGRELVVQLLIDDGVPSRGHRTNIMNKDFEQTGISFGKHPEFRTICVITYAKDYVSNEFIID
ncbi:MAG: CAP domain-containing protein [Treponema sp.]|nr:CAP domain-containing protein [Treponema sp.]